QYRGNGLQRHPSCTVLRFRVGCQEEALAPLQERSEKKRTISLRRRGYTLFFRPLQVGAAGRSFSRANAQRCPTGAEPSWTGRGTGPEVDPDGLPGGKPDRPIRLPPPRQ